MPADDRLIHSLSMVESFTTDLEPEEDDDKDNDSAYEWCSGLWSSNAYTDDLEPEDAF